MLSRKSALYPRLFQIGHFAIPTYGVFTALALVAALAALLHFARRLELNASKVWNFGLIGILTTLFSARLLLVAEYFGAFRAHPVWVLGLTASRSGWILPLALIAGSAAALLYALAEGLPLLRTLDCIAPSAALGLALNRAGAFLAGLGYGLPTTAHAWGVTYTSPLAYLWYRTPLGVKLYPVQIYEAGAAFAILGILDWRLPHQQQDGELAGAWLFLFGAAGSFLGLYRAGSPGHIVRDQILFIAMVIASCPLLLRRKSGGYTVDDDAPHT